MHQIKMQEAFSQLCTLNLGEFSPNPFPNTRRTCHQSLSNIP